MWKILGNIPIKLHLCSARKSLWEILFVGSVRVTRAGQSNNRAWQRATINDLESVRKHSTKDSSPTKLSRNHLF